MRHQSDYSENAYSSIQKCRDMLSPKDQNIPLSNTIKEEIKYFRKNKEPVKEAKEPLFERIYAFLEKNQQSLEDDPEFYLIKNNLR